MIKKETIIFKPSGKDQEFQIILDPEQDTIWLTEIQIAELFGRDRTVINRHINNSLEEGELDQDSTSTFFALVRKEGNRNITRDIKHYNLDAIISVGYRVKSPIATEFRKWATHKLKEYLIQGYSVNQELLKKQRYKIQQLDNEIQLLYEKSFEAQKQLTDGWISIVSHYSKSFELLNQYDSDGLSVDNLNKEIIYVINCIS